MKNDSFWYARVKHAWSYIGATYVNYRGYVDLKNGYVIEKK